MNKYLKYSIGKQLAYESEKGKGKESDGFFPSVLSFPHPSASGPQASADHSTTEMSCFVHFLVYEQVS